MSAYLTFIKQNFKPVLYGWMLTYYSSFGQTFLVSLYVPFLLSDLEMSKGAFGSFYAAATILASLLLLRFGHLVDERPLRPLTRKTIILVIVSTAILAVAWNPWILFIALIGMRLGGQGLFTHLSMSVMSRYFDSNRGKALSISSLGYSMGEMTFPAVLGGIIALFGWRIAAGSSIALLFLFLALLPWLRTQRMDLDANTARLNSESKGKRKFYIEMLQTKKFWIIATSSLGNGFAITGFFFYQFVMAEEKGWPVEVYTALFTGYGGVRLLMSIYGGSLTDKFSAIRIFPYILVPVTLGVLSLALSTSLISAALFLFGTGITLALVGVVKTAVLAEVYGVHNIGRVRSLFSVVAVFSTAISPMVFGILLDRGVSFEAIAWGCVGLFALGMLTASQIGQYRNPVHSA